MSNFVTDDILELWYSKLIKRFSCNCIVEREYTYIKKNLPFRALHMGKKHDEYFLDEQFKKIPTRDLLTDLNRLIVKNFQTNSDLSFENKQAKTARSIADLYVERETVQIVIELEVFKDKPFSNLVYIPEVCKSGRKIPFCFIHCFAPERQDKEAELTRQIGLWLQEQASIEKFEYVSFIMPPLPDSIKYLLPQKSKVKPKLYQRPQDRIFFQEYILDFYEQKIIPKMNDSLGFLDIETKSANTKRHEKTN